MKANIQRSRKEKRKVLVERRVVRRRRGRTKMMNMVRESMTQETQGEEKVRGKLVTRAKKTMIQLKEMETKIPMKMKTLAEELKTIKLQVMKKSQTKMETERQKETEMVKDYLQKKIKEIP